VIGEFDIYGVYFPAFAVFAAIALLLQIVINRLLGAFGFYRLVWHRALFDLAIYVILLGVVTAAGMSILPLA
jgi:protein AaeX